MSAEIQNKQFHPPTKFVGQIEARITSFVLVRFNQSCHTCEFPKEEFIRSPLESISNCFTIFFHRKIVLNFLVKLVTDQSSVLATSLYFRVFRKV